MIVLDLMETTDAMEDLCLWPMSTFKTLESVKSQLINTKPNNPNVKENKLKELDTKSLLLKMFKVKTV